MWATTPAATSVVTPRDIEWMAGFIEGEGCFTGGIRNISVQAAQVNMEPLLRLQRLLGGSIKVRREAVGNWQRCHGWRVTGTRARGVMMTIYGLMSKRRQGQIKMALLPDLAKVAA